MTKKFVFEKFVIFILKKNIKKYYKDELERLILVENLSYSYIGKMYGVSGNAIKKAAKNLGILLPKRRKINPNENFSHASKRKIKSKIDLKSDEEFSKIIQSCTSWKEMSKEFGYSNRMSSNVKEAVEKRCTKLGIVLNVQLCGNSNIEFRTKGELFKNSKNWQCARSTIQRNAREVFFNANVEHKCSICGYDKHVEVAHIKPVSEFDENTPIFEINSINNLIALCPNHHWEYDNGILKI